MSGTLLGDIKSDRVANGLLIDVSLLETYDDSPTDRRAIHLGAPDVQDNRMCAQCIGECKVF